MSKSTGQRGQFVKQKLHQHGAKTSKKQLRSAKSIS